MIINTLVRECVYYQKYPDDYLDIFGRGGGNRTHVRGFGDLRPTIERRPYDSDGIIQE